LEIATHLAIEVEGMVGKGNIGFEVRTMTAEFAQTMSEDKGVISEEE